MDNFREKVIMIVNTLMEDLENAKKSDPGRSWTDQDVMRDAILTSTDFNKIKALVRNEAFLLVKEKQLQNHDQTKLT